MAAAFFSRCQCTSRYMRAPGAPRAGRPLRLLRGRVRVRARRLAPIRRGDDGVPRLDISRLGGTPERLVVTYERNSKVVGCAAPQEL